jgi:NAD(P)-dependent dehydrogenase (short-subunit alcohol dehydrogenase family)
MAEGTSVVIGATSGIGLAVAEVLAQRGDTVIVTSRDADRAAETAVAIGGSTTGIAVDLTKPHGLARQLATVRDVRRLVIAAIERDDNTVGEYDIERALQLVTLKLVGYTEAIHALLPELRGDASIVLLGGLAKDRAYPGGTTVSAVNGAVEAMVRAFAVELGPIRVNALHPGIVGDSPAWSSRTEALAAIRKRTPTGRTIELADMADGVLFLLENRAANGINLTLDGGWLLT